MWIEVIPIWLDDNDDVANVMDVRYVMKLESNDSIAELLADASIKTSNLGVRLSDPKFRFTIQFKPMIEGYHHG